jgi:hypothetical protein
MTQIAEKQKQDTLWQIVLFGLVVVSLLYGASQGRPALALGLSSASYSAMYLVYLLMSYKYSEGNVPQQPRLNKFTQNLPRPNHFQTSFKRAASTAP